MFYTVHEAGVGCCTMYRRWELSVVHCTGVWRVLFCTIDEAGFAVIHFTGELIGILYNIQEGRLAWAWLRGRRGCGGPCTTASWTGGKGGFN